MEGKGILINVGERYVILRYRNWIFFYRTGAILKYGNMEFVNFNGIY